MNKHAPWLALGMLLAGCQAAANQKVAGPDNGGETKTTFEEQATRLTESQGELVLSRLHFDQDRKVALVIRYSEDADPGEHCTLSIIEQGGEGIVVVESSDQIMSCSGMSVPDAEAVRRGLEAKIGADFIRLDEDRIRNRSEYELVRAGDGRWHLAYSADIGPEEDADTGVLLVTSYAVAYRTALEGPIVSEVDRREVQRARERTVY